MIEGIIMLFITASLVGLYCIFQAEHVRKHRPALILYIIAIVFFLSCAGWLIVIS
ncbi:hypothetical protein [Alkalicoccobacillus plakortidis]|uniref:Uncharacterized protein n=1 Tax=Alkalicoccobacillus plakortidis TaxID=444060 RepID=A0ABT0XLF5_9BACI|nr:hypothetical protein [Alkalicoccobacillus plakortidis]MCM2676672.1 hypothetical protein [Alkalicoccobacillus plakortidis]